MSVPSSSPTGPSSDVWSADDGDWLAESDDSGPIPGVARGLAEEDPTGLIGSPVDGREQKLTGSELIAAISGGPGHEAGTAIERELSGIASAPRPRKPEKAAKPRRADRRKPSEATVETLTTAPPEKPRKPRKPSRSERNRARKAARVAEKRDYRRRPFWRGRILPRSVLGISLLMLAAGIGAASAGTALYMNYQYRRDQSDALVKSFPQRAKVAVDTVNAEAINARRRIQDEIEPIRKLAATGDTLRELLAKTAPSIWQVSTFDVDGAASAGTAFVVASDSTKSLLVTSYGVVRAGTAKPGPAITVRQGAETLDAQLWTWDEKRDLALLIIQKPSLPRLEWAISTDIRLGQQIFAVSGVGTAGGAITQGFVADVNVDGIQHTAALGAHFRGGPIITDRGVVVAVASRSYEPLGFASDGVWFAPPIRTACETLLKCPTGEVTGAGQVTGTGTQR